MADKVTLKGQVLGLRTDFIRDSDGTHFEGYPKIEHRDYGLVSMQDHAGNSDNTAEAFLGFDFGPDPVRVLPGAELRLVHRGSYVRYDPNSPTREDRFREQDNSILVDFVDLGQELDVADGSGTKPGQNVGGTEKWPQGYRGTVISIPLNVGFEIPGGEENNTALRLRSWLPLNNNPEWIERESWMEAFELDGIELVAEIEKIEPAADPDTEGETVAFLRSLIEDPRMMEFFQLIRENPDLIPFFQQIAAAQQP